VKPPPFAYHAPDDLPAALRLLADLGPDAKVLAGGQSLIPLLNMRLAAPAHIVDINRLTELDTIDDDDGGGVRVGALVRHARLERDGAAARAQPLLRRALRLVAHPVIRNRGTVVGSLAHADPAAEMPAVLALLGGEVELAGADATRTVAADAFFLGPLESAARPDELAVAARFPPAPARSGSAFEEVTRRHGDYALAGVAVAVTLDDDLRVATARAAYVGLGSPPPVLDLAPVARTDLRAYVAERVDAEPDIHASADYRRHLAGVLTERALDAAVRDARGRP
jgi:carbon-monoxide dehydrogenase medium subunit